MLTQHFLYARHCSHFFANVNSFNIHSPMRWVLLLLLSSSLSLPSIHSWQAAELRHTGWHSSSLTSPLSSARLLLSKTDSWARGTHPSIYTGTEEQTLLVTDRWESPKDMGPLRPHSDEFRNI